MNYIPRSIVSDLDIGPILIFGCIDIDLVHTSNDIRYASVPVGTEISGYRNYMGPIAT